MKESLTIYIGGEAGQGLATVGELLSRVLAKAGHNFLTFQGYHSRIRGGHNTFSIKISENELCGPDEGADIVLSLDETTDAVDAPRLRQGGLLLSFGPAAKAPDGSKTLAVPFKELGKPREWNIVALGILLAASGLPFENAVEVVGSFFSGKGGAEEPLASLKKGFDWAEPLIGDEFKIKPALPPSAKRLLINGNDALALGAAAGGVNFCSFYPMSPATTIALSLAAWAAKSGLVVEQAEDEIAAINMAIGASYGGAVPIVPTSGGGFALMVEGVSLAAMTETPVVIAIVQRPGPATGLPTRTEQADLNLALYAGHGEFPRAIFSPACAEECFELAGLAAHLAEASQGPVFILSDQYLADCVRPIKPFDFSALPEAVNTVALNNDNLKKIKTDAEYLRYADSESGVSPRLLPGFSDHLVKADSDEHTPDGHITEDLTWRLKQQDKRMRKLGLLVDAVQAPAYDGAEAAETILVSWGSTKGAVLEAVQHLNNNGIKAASLHFSQVYPLKPDQWLTKLKKAKMVVFVEGNAEGQFAQLVQRETCFRPHRKISRYDGLPVTASYILERLEVK